MRLILVAALVLSGCVSSPPESLPEAPEAIAPDGALLAALEELASFPEIRMETDHGTIRMLLYQAWTPQTAAHIGGLVEQGFYDGLIFHRVVDDFVIQGGDPTQTGEGGSGPGGASTNMVPLEIKDGLQFGSGAVGLARWTDDTGDSQLFITEKPALHLNDPQGATGDVFGAYSLFAQVFSGFDVVRSIAAVETLPNDRPVQDVHIVGAELLAPPTDADLLGLVPVVHVVDGLEIEWPRHLVKDHPFTIRASGSCGADVRIQFVTPGGAAHQARLLPVDHDGCTHETELRLPNNGTTQVGIGFGPDTNVFATVEVLPWHDDYAAFAGAKR